MIQMQSNLDVADNSGAKRVLVIRAVHYDDGFAHGCCVARIKGSIPLLILLAKTDDENVALLDALADANGVELGAALIVPELVCFWPRDHRSAIVGKRVIGDWTRKIDVQALALRDDGIAPIGMDFAGKIDVQHGGAPLNCDGSPLCLSVCAKTSF